MRGDGCGSWCGYCGACDKGAQRGWDQRTCSGCKRKFWMCAADEYVMHPLCDRCCQKRDQKHDEHMERIR